MAIQIERPFQHLPDSSTYEQISKQLQSGVYADVIANFQKIRELNLLKSIRLNLMSHDRIFVQCGFVHRTSTERVIKDVLALNYTLSGDSVKQLLRSQILTTDTLIQQDKLYFKTFIFNNKKVVICATRATQNFRDDSAVVKIKKLIKDTSPSILLVSNFKPIDSTASSSYKLYGDESLYRFVAQESKITINTWARYWSYLYYKLSLKYPKEHVFYTILFYNMNKYKNVYKNNFFTYQAYFEYVANQLITELYPWRYDGKSLYNIYDDCRKSVSGLPDEQHGIMNNIQYALQCPELAPIARDLEKYKSDELFLSLQEALKDNDTILVQTDWDYIKALYQ